MRILHLTSHLNVGGVTSSILSLSRALTRRGHQVIIASGGGALEAQAAAWGAAHWPASLRTSVEFSPQVHGAAQHLASRLRDEPVDVLHAHTRVGQVVAAWLSRARRVPYVATWHGFFRPNPGRWLWPCTGRLTIAISEPVRQHLLRDFRVAPERIRLIPHGIDPAPFVSPVEADAQEHLRSRLGLPADAAVVGTVARLVASKGVSQLIRSLPPIRRAMPAARLLIVGDGEARAGLERLAEQEGVRDAVHFAGSLPETRVALSLMRVFVFLPAEQEGFGLSLLEAMASGRPIVAVRRGGGASWVLEEAGVGSLVPPDDPQALAAAAVRVLQDGETACREAGKARTIVKERYTINRMVDQTEAVYKEVTGGSAEFGVRNAE
ncbi:MAG: glycosyltransferase family 4 protein [Candidatus Omnitrophica bacterium]|nr:glycosyltransferase family 4 protein [Candidatus Omnitrophota bacterium]